MVEDVAEVEARIAEALLPLIAPQRVGSALLPPPAYVRRHLVEHAAAGGVLDDRVLSETFLPFVDATRLRPLQPSPAVSERGNALLRAWRHAAHRWRWDSSDANADALAFRMAGLGYPTGAPGAATGWATTWAHLHLGSGDILARHPISAVATLVLPDGRPVAVTGGRDATVRVWDLSTGAPVGEPLTGHTGPVWAVAAVVLPDGRPVAVTAGWDATVRVWDLSTGAPVGEPLTGHTGEVGAVATLVLPDGRPVAVTGSRDGTVRVWKLAAGPDAEAVIPVPGPVRALTVVCSNGRAWIVIAGAGHACIEITSTSSTA